MRNRNTALSRRRYCHTSFLLKSCLRWSTNTVYPKHKQQPKHSQEIKYVLLATTVFPRCWSCRNHVTSLPAVPVDGGHSVTTDIALWDIIRPVRVMASLAQVLNWESNWSQLTHWGPVATGCSWDHLQLALLVPQAPATPSCNHFGPSLPAETWSVPPSC